MPAHDIIVIGASAGGVEALIQLVALLPADLSAALFIVVHFPAQGKSLLPNILNRQGHLHAAPAQDNEVIKHGRIYLAPPDYHLLVKEGYIPLVQNSKENGARSSVDLLFRTAAKVYSSRVVGVVLSGMLDDQRHVSLSEHTPAARRRRTAHHIATQTHPESAIVDYTQRWGLKRSSASSTHAASVQSPPT